MADAPDDEADRDLTFAQLLEQAGPSEPDASDQAAAIRPRARDDELLTELPARDDHHLGHFAGWRAHRKLRMFIGGTLAAALVVGGIVLILHTREIRHERLHPLPELEATITPGTPRDMTISEG